jgi:hypothetical protein
MSRQCLKFPGGVEGGALLLWLSLGVGAKDVDRKEGS